MSYFKINDVDYSMFVSELKINKSAVYNTQTNANGDTVVDYVNSKRVIEVGIIALTDSIMSVLQKTIDRFNVSISFRNPNTNLLETGVNCIIPDNNVEYYTIQKDKVMYKALTLKFIEL